MDIFVNMDENGRMTLPSKVRKKYGTRRFILRTKEKEVILKPVMSVEDLFGSLPDLDIDRLKKGHIQEVKNEADD